jgi:metalloendopeptidase OMA1, mitochondrial
MLDLVQADDNMLAVVLAHEVAHTLARHLQEDKALARFQLFVCLPTLPPAILGVFDLGAALVAGVLLSEELAIPILLPTVAACIPLAVAVELLSPRNRKQEQEADLIGLFHMTEAGFDPRAAPPFWKLVVDLQEHETKRQREKRSEERKKKGLRKEREEAHTPAEDFFSTHPAVSRHFLGSNP